ncbi:MAG: hypothetical protein ACYS0I_20930 [Planctomycetota bacterium]
MLQNLSSLPVGLPQLGQNFALHGGFWAGSSSVGGYLPNKENYDNYTTHNGSYDGPINTGIGV